MRTCTFCRNGSLSTPRIRSMATNDALTTPENASRRCSALSSGAPFR
jgi:hypothetical protein